MAKRNKLKLMILVILLALVSGLQAQRFQHGKLKGMITDKTTNEPLEAVSVYLTNAKLGKKIGSTTDEKGIYTIHNIPYGDYVLVAEYVGYHKVVIENFKIFFSDYRDLDITMKIDEIQLSEISVMVEAERTGKEILIQKRQTEIVVADAISAEEISSYGSGDAAAAMKHVTGASVEDGKYVFVRGLGNRYSTVHLNGIELPSADPDENSFQLDLVSSSVMEDISTSKSFTPDKPGNFAGGLVDIATKSLTEDSYVKVSVSNGINTNTTFGDYLTYKGGDTDWLAYDDGSRDVPDEIANTNVKVLVPMPFISTLNDSARILNTQNSLDLDRCSRSFNSIMTPIEQTAPVNQSYGLNFGKKLKFRESRFLDILSTVKYSRKFESYDDGIINNYVLTGSGATELMNEFSFTETKGEENIDINGLLNLQYRLNENNDLFFNTMFTQSATDVARYITGHYFDGNMEPDDTYETRVLKWTERQLLSNQIRGKHVFDKLWSTELEWNGTISNTSQKEPDTRFFSNHYSDDLDIYVYEDPDTGDMIADTLGIVRSYYISPSLYKEPSRYYRDMNEDSYNFDIKATFPFSIYRNGDSKLTSGFYLSKKERSFRENSYAISNASQAGYLFNDYGGDPELYFTENMGIQDVSTLQSNVRYTWGNYIKDTTEKRSNYDGEQSINAVFAMGDLPLTDRLNITAGARFEMTEMETSTLDSTYEQGKISENDLLPACLLNYRLKDNIVAKLSYGRTLARPSLRELAPFPSLDFAGGFFFTGNAELERTLIDNYDLRVDYFERPGELYSISMYYKYFKNPIEKAFLNDNKEIQYQNVSRAQVKGVELEIKKDLDQLHPLMKYFFISTNFSYIISEVKIPDSEMAAVLAADPDAEDTRPLEGQPEYIFNLYFQYNNNDTKTNASINFNLTGEKLSENSKGGTPDIYELPAHKLGLSFSQKFLKNYEVRFGADNLLNTPVEKVYHFKGNDYTFSKYKKGSEYSLSLSYSL